MSACGAAAVIYATHFGPAVDGDSARYLSAAEHLASGQGYFTDVEGQLTPFVHFPPLLSSILAVSNLLALDTLTFARWLYASLLVLNALSVGWIVWYWTRARFAAALATFFFIISPGMIATHATILSEPLFIALMLWVFHFFARYLREGDYRPFGFAAVCAAAAFQTRYAGAAIVLFMGFAILLRAGWPYRRRIVDAAILGLVAVGPMLLWFARNSRVGGDARTIAFHPVSRSTLLQGVSSVLGWINPAFGIRTRVLLPAVAVTALSLVAWTRRSSKHPRAGTRRKELPAVLLGFVPSYVLFLLGSITFIDFQTPLDHRLLLPVFVSIIILAGIAFADLQSAPANPYVRAGAGVLICWFAAAFGLAAAKSVRWAHDDGLDFQSRVWVASNVRSYLAALPRTTLVYSNWHTAVYYTAGHRAVSIPTKRNPYSAAVNTAYAAESSALCRDVTRGGVIAYFKAKENSAFLPKLEELERIVPLRSVVSDTLGTVFRAAVLDPSICTRHQQDRRF